MPPLPSPLVVALTTLPRSCWECQRRRRRCDMSRPECHKCLTDGTMCPGYDKKKPVTWLAPGTVLSRPRRQKLSQQRQETTNITEHTDSSAKLPRLEMTAFNTIPKFEWVDETTTMLETLVYFNSQVYSNLSHTLDLGPNPYAVKIPPEYLPYLSTSYQHNLVSLAISHRIHQLPEGTSSIVLKTLRLRIHHHHSIAVQAVRRCIEIEAPVISNTITGEILNLMFVELQFSPMGNTWRYHHDGFMEVVKLRGGFENLFKSDTRFDFSLLSFMIAGIMANTTAPASKQTAATTYYLSMPFISKLYKSVIYPTLLCPHPLLMHIIAINYLRHEVSNSNIPIEDGHTRAVALVNTINEFSLEHWVRADAPLQELWLIAGQVYHSAVLLYSITAFQALLLLPETLQIRSIKVRHCTRLYRFLPQALQAPQLRPSMCWPLVVAGLHAEGTNTTYRHFVIVALIQLSRDTGVSLPLAATAVLEKHWANGKESWDDGFDRSYMFAW